MKCSIIALSFVSLAALTGCESDDPVREDTPEMITQVTLTFTPAGGAPIVATATDPDGEGVQDLETDGPIDLLPGTTYTLRISLINSLAQAGSEGYDVSAEVEEEADEHMFFFGWEGNVFSDPAGNGNIDSRNDVVNYLDEDTQGFPLGLETQWTTATTAASGSLRVVLKHQPDIKSASSTVSTGESDLDIEFVVNVQ